jgi:hypothetical protein
MVGLAAVLISVPITQQEDLSLAGSQKNINSNHHAAI